MQREVKIEIDKLKILCSYFNIWVHFHCRTNIILSHKREIFTS